MRPYSLAFAFNIVLTIPVAAQTPMQQLGVLGRPEREPQGLGPTNFWAAGAQVAYNLSSGSFKDNFEASGQSVLETLGGKGKHWSIPVLGNLSKLSADPDSGARVASLRQLQQSSQGVFVALYPQYTRGDPKKSSLTFYVSFGWKLNAVRDTLDSLQYLNQERLSVGVEGSGLNGLVSQLPATVSLEGALTFVKRRLFRQVFRLDHATLKTFVMTVVIPAGPGRGLLFEGATSANLPPAYRLGLMLTGTVK